MKIISLNTWCGIVYEPLIKFVESHGVDTDIFCFQEVRNGYYQDKNKGVNERPSFYSDVEKILPGHRGYFSEMSQGVGIATFVKKEFEIEKVDTHEILSKEDTNHIKMEDGWSYYSRLMQSIIFRDKNIVIHNFHGIPGNFKKDTPERILQTDRILEILNSHNMPQLIVGDFNLDIDTDAIKRIEKKMKNLIRHSGIKTTRNSLYKSYETLPFADYAFVSNEIKVQNFEVLNDEVSDHLALSLEIDL